jgi:hypothetical protein
MNIIDALGVNGGTNKAIICIYWVSVLQGRVQIARESHHKQAQ